MENKATVSIAKVRNKTDFECVKLGYLYKNYNKNRVTY